MDKHVFNLFRIENLTDLKTSYRLLDVEGEYGQNVGDGDLADRNLHLLAKQFALRERRPVALVRGGQGMQLAVPADLVLSQTDYALTPEFVSLRPRDEVHSLSLAELNAQNSKIALAFLQFHLRTPLWSNRQLWSTSPTTYFSKSPVNYRSDQRDVAVYGGFGYRLVPIEGQLFLSLWLTYKYGDAEWLLDRYDDVAIRGLKMRHMLYHYGDRWYTVQFKGLTGRSVKEQTFVANGQRPENVFDYTLANAGTMTAPWMQALLPDSPAITYQYPGKEQQPHRYGAAALCKLLLSTDDPRVKSCHRLSIKPPADRVDIPEKLVREYFGDVAFEGIPIRIAGRAWSEPPKVFNVPPQRFGQGQVLRVTEQGGNGTIALRDLGDKRFDLLLNPQAGIAVSGLRDTQYFLVPDTLERELVEDFRERLQKTMQSFLHSPYRFETVIYLNRGRKTLKQQVDGIGDALTRVGSPTWRGVLVLPDQAQRDLHNFVKRQLREKLQVQCVAASSLREFYQLNRSGKVPIVTVPRHAEGKFAGYLRHTALGLLLVNQQWPWILNEGTHHDMYIGVDVLNNTAAFTFFSEGGQRCFMRLVSSKQKERLLSKTISQVIYENLANELRNGAPPPRSIILRRDGKAFQSECRGFEEALRRLMREELLPAETRFGVVEVHKHTASGLRLIVRKANGERTNPQIGAWRELSDREGIVCTTGLPFRFSGTVKPLFVRIVLGNLDIVEVLEDTFRMSQLCWPVPGRCMRLPVDLKLCDDTLRSAAADADEDEALFDDEEDESVVGQEASA